MDIDFGALRKTFLAETEEGLGRMEASILRLEERPEDEEGLGEVFRTVHTLKGDALSVGFPAPAALAHGVEDLLDSIRSGSAPLTGEMVTLLLESVDAFRDLLDSAQEGGEKLSSRHRKLLEEMREQIVTPPVPSESGESSGFAGAPQEPIRESDARITRKARAASSGGAATLRTETLRIGISKLDQLLTLVGEISVARGRLSQLLEDRTAEQDLILEEHRGAEQLYLDLQELVMKLRMVPVGPVFRQYARTIRDLSRAHGKKVRLVIEEGDVEVDNSVLQLLRDPLAHMIRNAVDHGIEPPEVRKSRGKRATGRVLLRAHHVAGSIVIDLEDDGAGLDRERILARARALGKFGGEETPPEQELLNMVFDPGFSTAEEISETSGRGVGMDVVRRNIEALRGSVDISSEAGQGTRVTIRLPLTLAIIDGLLVRVADESYVIPLDTVIESVDLPPEARSKNEGRGVVRVRARTLPYVRLREIFQTNGSIPARENLVIVQLGDEEVGLVVDEVFGKSHTVIKPLAKIFQNLKGISGSAILGNGQVAMILDVPTLIRREIARGKRSQVASRL